MIPRVVTPGVAFGRLRRFQQVVNVLAKHGFGEALSRIRVWECEHIQRGILKRQCELPQYNVPQRIRLAIEELGPTFIKLGQVLSTRPDLVPREIIVELKKLQTSVQFIPVDIVRKTVESELGRPISEIFDSFDDTPLAAASLAQVHRAVYKGQQVVLKVQRPDIAETAELDIDIMSSLAGVAERYSPALYLINPLGLVEEFAQQIRKELDFRLEANNAHRFARNFAHDETIHVPKVYPDLCTKRVLTAEFLDGINISDVKKLKDEGYNLSLIARRGAILGFKATFEYGFFHADPHPGNLIIMPDNVIGVVDYGMMATLSLRDRERLAKLVYFTAIRDEKRVARALNELMESEDVISAEQLEPAMAGIMREYGDVPTGELLFASMLFAMMRAILAHNGRLRSQLVWVTKSIATQEDIAHSLQADFNITDLARPFAQRLLIQKINPIRKPREFSYWLLDIMDMFSDLPYEISVMIHEFRKGKLKIEFEHVGLEPIRKTMELVSNRMSLTILTAALLVSSSVIVLAKVPPFIGNIPVLAFVGYLSAILLSFMLAASILLRRGPPR